MDTTHNISDLSVTHKYPSGYNIVRRLTSCISIARKSWESLVLDPPSYNPPITSYASN